jgi:hypothetical protein
LESEEPQDLAAVYDMYAEVLSGGFTPQALCVASDQGPCWIFPDGTGVLMDEDGNTVGEVEWTVNPEWEFGA